MYTAKLNCPNFRVLSDFRKQHGEFFKECFRQTVQLAMEMGLVSLGHVSLDGSKFKANSSKYKAMSYGNLKQQEQKLMVEVDSLIAQAKACDEEEDARYQDKTGDELPADIQFKQQRLARIKEAKEALEKRERARHANSDIDPKKQISFSDKEANIMGKGGHFEYAYNGQISVDSQHQIIVGQHVSDRANDQQEVEAGLASIEQNTGALPEKMSLDNGYHSGANLATLEKAGVDTYIPSGREGLSSDKASDDPQRRLQKSDFTYDKSADEFTCPHGQRLALKSVDKNGRRQYQGQAKVCTACADYPRCCQSQSGQGRIVTTEAREDLRQKMRVKMESVEAKTIYSKRKVIVEPVFGQIKNKGFRGFSLRGKSKVAGEFSLVCLAHNMKKMVKARMTGLVRPESGMMAVNGI